MLLGLGPSVTLRAIYRSAVQQQQKSTHKHMSSFAAYHARVSGFFNVSSGGITREGLRGADSHFRAGAMHYGTWDTRIILELQRAVKSVLKGVKSVKRAARLPLQVGHKGSELAACLPRGHGLAGWRGLPTPAPHPGSGICVAFTPSRVPHLTNEALRHTDTVCQCGYVQSRHQLCTDSEEHHCFWRRPRGNRDFAMAWGCAGAHPGMLLVSTTSGMHRRPAAPSVSVGAAGRSS